jgi:hypothetical protein
MSKQAQELTHDERHFLKWLRRKSEDTIEAWRKRSFNKNGFYEPEAERVERSNDPQAFEAEQARRKRDVQERMAHGIDAQTEVVECAVFNPGTLFRTIFKEPVIVGMNDVLETEWTKEGLQVTLNGVKVESRTMVVCGGDKDKRPSKQGYHDVWEFYKDEE